MDDEIVRLRREVEKLTAEVGHLTWMLRSQSYDLIEAFAMTPGDAALVGLLMSGRWYTWEQIAAAACREGVERAAVDMKVWKIKRRHPWLKIHGNRQSGYRLDEASRRTIKDKIAALT